MKTKMKIKIIEVAYHRNGISGLGFYAVLFTAMAFRRMDATFLATVFEEEGACAVICLDVIKDHGVSKDYNAWRGDNFEPELRKAISAYESSIQPES